MSHLVERLAVRKSECLGDEGHQLLSGIVGELDRMQTLVSELLDYSRVSGGPIERQATDCARLLEQTLDLLESRVAERSATVTHGVMPVIHAHPTPVGQLFQNLVSNALKFARPDVSLRIHISARHETGAWEFSVEDNGIGIDPRQAEQAFEPYSRLDPRDGDAGVGIGLAICKRIVTRYGGRIWVEPSCGGGCSFHFTIPDTATTSRKPRLELAALN